jgi:6-pyruvoyltetrahydropterin/6-carboxytetrahydropterin synthase
MIYAKRYHDISTGHRVPGHEGACKNLHGHNYRIHFTVEAPELDALGRVIDFGVIKSTLCQWLEENWDHRFLVWTDDPWREALMQLDPMVLEVPFCPTAENLALHLLNVIGPKLLPEGLILRSVLIEETRKCSAEVSV